MFYTDYFSTLFAMKYLVCLFIFIIPFYAFGDDCTISKENPFMGKYKDQMAFGIGQGFDTGLLIPPPYKPVPFYILNFQYSQPTTFFRIPAKYSVNISQTAGFGNKNGWNWSHFTIPIAYLSEDIALLNYDKMYFATGAGAGLQAHQNERLGSKLLFTLKLTLGYRFNEIWNGELFIQHFSNANTAEENNSYAFYGFGLTYNF